MSNTGLLTIIAVILMGLFTILVIQMNDETSTKEIRQSVSGTVNAPQNGVDNN